MQEVRDAAYKIHTAARAYFTPGRHMSRPNANQSSIVGSRRAAVSQIDSCICLATLRPMAACDSVMKRVACARLSVHARVVQLEHAHGVVVFS